jgi:hypothetical protein
MAYNQYTKCVDIQDFDPRNPYVQAAWLGLYITLPVAIVAALQAIAYSMPLCLPYLAEVYVIAGIFGYCYWWLYRRLVCLPAPPGHPADAAGDHLAIGLLIDIAPPSSATFPDLDNDYSVGILLQCNPLGAGSPGVQNPCVSTSEPYGYLVTPQPVTVNYPLPYRPKMGVDHDFPNHPELEIASEVLHCEFEGRAIYDMLLASGAALLPAALATLACVIPYVGWIIALILALIAAAILGLGWVAGQFDGGDPSDVSPNIGEFHRNDDKHEGADTLVIKGHWVYDSGHRFDHTPPDGYYELHPVTFCTKTHKLCGEIPYRDRWQAAINNATSPVTLENQKLPQNQWQVHPLLDGCQPVVIV